MNNKAKLQKIAIMQTLIEYIDGTGLSVGHSPCRMSNLFDMLLKSRYKNALSDACAGLMPNI
ncbi:MAG: hypothetical protein OXE85_15220 [Roseovarius sp.]|nr:hypothetical protein [Roseovarius sp.]